MGAQLIDSGTVEFYPVLEFVQKTMEIVPIYYVSGNREARNEYYKTFGKLLGLEIVVPSNGVVIIELVGDEIVSLGFQRPYFLIGSNFLMKRKV